jgi:LysM repeat protein
MMTGPSAIPAGNSVSSTSRALMHPDRKIGIAMGILLVGVVAALFFRNEPLAVDEGLSSNREQELNQKLRDRDVSVYLDPEVQSGSEGLTTELEWTLPELFDQVRSSDAVPIPIETRTPLIDEPVSEPVVQRDASRFVPPTSSVRQEDPQQVENVKTQDETVAAVKDTRTKRADPSSVGNTEYQEYTVQFGDTLSEISEKFLGSQKRYREIYELNKDRISSPDRLKVGRAIRVPRQLH